MDNANERNIVTAIIKRDSEVTRQVLYVQCYPLFKSIFERYDTDCESCLEFINEIYIYIMSPRGTDKKSYLEGFTFKCRFLHWLKIIAESYCHRVFKKKKDFLEKSLDDSERNHGLEGSINKTLESINAMDVQTLLNLMPNERYRKLIYYMYVEERSNEETAELLGMSMSNFYNKHHLAKKQFFEILRKEENMNH